MKKFNKLLVITILTWSVFAITSIGFSESTVHRSFNNNGTVLETKKIELIPTIISSKPLINKSSSIENNTKQLVATEVKKDLAADTNINSPKQEDITSNTKQESKNTMNYPPPLSKFFYIPKIKILKRLLI